MELTREEEYLIKLCREYLSSEDMGILATFIEDISANGKGAVFEWLATHLKLEQEMSKAAGERKG